MKKDIEWMKRSITDIIDYHYEYPLINGHTQGMINEIKKVMEQAEEPETLTPKQEEVDQAYKDGYAKGQCVVLYNRDDQATFRVEHLFHIGGILKLSLRRVENEKN